jgi:hypothetical protein
VSSILHVLSEVIDGHSTNVATTEQPPCTHRRR